MSTEYTGDPDNVSTSLSATVTGATNATPIVITTGAAHGYSDNDYINVVNVGGNTAANGEWRITYLSATTFSLDSSVGNGAYTAGGTCTDHNFTPPLTIPSDGDLRSAASVNGALDLLADRTQHLLTRGTHKVDYFNAASGTWTCPPNVTEIELFCTPSGGGGAGGGGGNTVTSGTSALGGGAGGGGKKVRTWITGLTPGTVYAYVNGTPGVAGAGGAAGGSPGVVGGDAADSTFNAVVVGRGGGGGWSSSAPYLFAAYQYGYVPGGAAPRAGTAGAPAASNQIDANLLRIPVAAHAGGAGGTGGSSIGQAAGDGGGAFEGPAGGAAGAAGAAGAPKNGGGGGGGGGASSLFAGGAGGAGGVGGGGGAGGAGVAGSVGAGAGAGGGGGGAGGQGTGAGGAGAAGAAGLRGTIEIRYVGVQAAYT